MSFKKRWKNLPYWLKGGILIFPIFIITIIILGLIFSLISGGECIIERQAIHGGQFIDKSFNICFQKSYRTSTYLFVWPAYVLNFITKLIPPLSIRYSVRYANIAESIILIIFLASIFLNGAIVGYIIEKINRKTNSSFLRK